MNSPIQSFFNPPGSPPGAGGPGVSRGAGWGLATLLGIILLVNVWHLFRSFPYQSGSRILFTLLVVGHAVFLGVIGARVFRRVSLLFLAPVVGALAGAVPVFALELPNHSLTATVSISLLLVFLVWAEEKDTLLYKAVIPGVLSGMILAGNPGLWPLLLVPVPVILLFGREGRFLKIVLFLTVTAGMAVVSIPVAFYLFFPLEIVQPGGVGYLSGGLNALIHHVGPLGLLLFVPGLIMAFRKQLKWALILLLLLTACVFLPGALFCAGGIYAVFAALGLLEVTGFFLNLWKKSTGAAAVPGKGAAVTVVIVSAVLLILLFPFSRRMDDWFNVPPDTRVGAGAWIKGNIKKSSVLAFPRQLGLATGSLEQDYMLYPVRWKQLTPRRLNTLAVILENPYFILPTVTLPGNHAADTEKMNLFNRLHELLEPGAEFPGNKLRLGGYSFLRAVNPGIRLGRMKPSLLKPLPGLRLWNGKPGIKPRRISRHFGVMYKRGEFRLDFSSGEGGNRLVIRNTEADDEGNRKLSFGFDSKRGGIPLEEVRGKYVHFVVTASVSPGLIGDGGYFYVSDRTADKKDTDRVSRRYASSNRKIYIVSKRIRENAERVFLGGRLVHALPEDVLEITDIKVVISEAGEI